MTATAIARPRRPGPLVTPNNIEPGPVAERQTQRT